MCYNCLYYIAVLIRGLVGWLAWYTSLDVWDFIYKRGLDDLSSALFSSGSDLFLLTLRMGGTMVEKKRAQKKHLIDGRPEDLKGREQSIPQDRIGAMLLPRKRQEGTGSRQTTTTHAFVYIFAFFFCYLGFVAGCRELRGDDTKFLFFLLGDHSRRLILSEDYELKRKRKRKRRGLSINFKLQ